MLLPSFDPTSVLAAIKMIVSAPIAIGFNVVGGILLMIFLSRLAEHRVDDISSGIAMTNSRRARRERWRASNYDSHGKKLLRWYQFIMILSFLMNLFFWIVLLG
jgi:hypothetical protein